MATPCSSANATEQFLFTDWNAFIPVDQNMEFNGSVNPSSCNAAPPQSDGGIVEQIMKPCFNNLSIHEMDCSFCLSAGCQIHGNFCTSDSNLSNNHFNEINVKGKKRKTEFEGGGLQLDPPSTKSSDSKEKKVESSSALRTRKSASKQAKEISKDGDSPKEEFMHIRAKRGHATNSHSLAERVRREKISERMRVLQDLVPGCNKITGKAVMLDEIINYVQSLQRQVEFLSMKLAAVDPELKFDLEQIFHEDVYLLGRDPGILGLGSGLGGQVPQFHGAGQIPPEMLMAMTRTQHFAIDQIPKIPNTWDDEIQSAIQIGFIPHHPVHNSGSNGKDPEVC